MAIDQNRLMQSVYDTIFDALTTTPSGIGDGRAIEPRQSTYLSLALPGNPVDVGQFANAWSPANPEGLPYAAENFALFVDDIPTLSPRHVGSGVSIDTTYQEIINANVVPPRPDPAAQAAYDRAFNILYTDGTDYDDQGRQVTVKVESPMYRNYKNKRAAYNAALLSYLTNYNSFDLSKPADARRWSILAPALQAPVDAAYSDLQSARPGVVESAVATLGQHEASSLAGIFTRARQVYDMTRRGSVTGGAFWHHCEAFPGNWFAEAAAANFTGITIESRQLRISESSRFTSWSAGGGVNFGLWRVGGSVSSSSQRHDMSTDSSEIRISFKLGRVEIRRRWLNAGLFSLAGWSAAGRAPGGFSNGQAANNPGLFPLLPTSFIVARDIQISGRWGSTDSHFASQSISGRASVGWGPFSLSGSYSNSSSNRTFNSTFDGTTISAPGIQVIGWISSIVPFCPPTGAPSGQPIAIPAAQPTRRRNPYHLSEDSGPDTSTGSPDSLPQPAPAVALPAPGPQPAPRGPALAAISDQPIPRFLSAEQ